MKLADESKSVIKIRICDTAGARSAVSGVAMPRSVPGLIYGLQYTPGCPASWLEWHGHNDLFLVTSNAVTAWLYGCSAGQWDNSGDRRAHRQPADRRACRELPPVARPTTRTLIPRSSPRSSSTSRGSCTWTFPPCSRLWEAASIRRAPGCTPTVPEERRNLQRLQHGQDTHRPITLAAHGPRADLPGIVPLGEAPHREGKTPLSKDHPA